MKIVNRFKKLVYPFYKTVKTATNGEKDFLLVAIDYIYSKMRFHITADEYLKYNFFNLKNRYRKKFVLVHHQMKYDHISARSFTRSKYIFYKRIPDLYQREILLIPYCGENAFLDFARKHKKIIIKPDQGSLGKGIEIFKYSNDDSAREIFNKFSKKTPMIVEEYISQHELLNELNPFSVNTVRIVSILYNGEVEIVSAALKTGGSCDVYDNMHRGGIGAQVDIPTGTVTTFGTDYQYNSYTHHPISGKKLIGFCIPNWDIVIALVKEAHRRLPQCLIYGWDLAITPTGVDIVEANNCPGPKLMQTMDQVPKGDKIIKMIKHTKIKQEYSKKNPYIPDYDSLFPPEE